NMKLARSMVLCCVVGCLLSMGVVASGARPARISASPQACDGTWQIVPGPALGRQGGLTAITATSGTDIWALGANKDGELVAHWDGEAWTVTNLLPAGVSDDLLSISAASPTDVWAVGWSEATRHSPQRGLVYHFDGVS